KGTVSTRLTRARELLRRRLLCRGEAFSAAAPPPAIAKFTLPPGLVQPTLRAALAFQTPAAAAGLASAKAVTLAQGALHALAAGQWKLMALLLLAVAALGTGAGWLGYRATRAAPKSGEDSPAAQQVSAPDPTADRGPAAPLRRLDPSQIPPEDRFAWQPAELVAVLGEHRGRHWGDMLDVTFSPDGR